MSIHPTAVISPSARIGAGVCVGPFACIDDDVVVGDGCVIGPHACLLRFTTIGRNCRVHAHAVLGDLPQDRSFRGDDSFVVVGDDCVIREGVTIHRGTLPGSTTRIGNGCLLMAQCHVAHNVSIGDQVIIVNNALLGGHVEVGSRAVISGNCMVHQHARIGRLAMLSGGSGAQMDVPPFCMTRSICTNKIMSLNVVGLRRAGFSVEDRRELHQAFRILYRSGLSVPRAVERLEREFTCPYVREMADFLKASKRGICSFIQSGRYADAGRDADETPRLMAA